MSEPQVTFEKLHPDARRPVRATARSAGFDLWAYLRGRVVRLYGASDGGRRELEPGGSGDGGPRLRLPPGSRCPVPTGFRARLPDGYEAQIRIRSSQALEKGLVVPNAPGTIDADYPDEWFVLIRNASDRVQELRHGERIAQAVLSRYEVLPWREGAVEQSTDRTGGLGSTGN